MDRTAENLLALSKRIGELKQALAAEKRARRKAEEYLHDLLRRAQHRWNGPLPDVGEVADDPEHFG